MNFDGASIESVEQRSAPSPRVSVVMAEYNTPPELLRRSLMSLLNQEFRDFEVLIVDDCGSTDLDGIVSSLADERIRVLRNPKNLGLARSLNAGIKAARSDLIARTDTDDYVEPSHLQTLLAFMESRPEYTAVSTRAYETSDVGASFVIASPGEKTLRSIARGDGLLHPASMVRRAALDVVGGYPTRFERAEDFALWNELLLRGYRLAVLDAITLHYTVDRSDYSKRALRKRAGELSARWHYGRLSGNRMASLIRSAVSIASALLPVPLARALRRGWHR